MGAFMMILGTLMILAVPILAFAIIVQFFRKKKINYS